MILNCPSNWNRIIVIIFSIKLFVNSKKQKGNSRLLHTRTALYYIQSIGISSRFFISFLFCILFLFFLLFFFSRSLHTHSSLRFRKLVTVCRALNSVESIGSENCTKKILYCVKDYQFFKCLVKKKKSKINNL